MGLERAPASWNSSEKHALQEINPSPEMHPALTVDQLTAAVAGRERYYLTLNEVSFSLPARAVIGVVGESGAGKTQLILSLAGLNPLEPGIIGGAIYLHNRDLLAGLGVACRKIKTPDGLRIKKNRRQYQNLLTQSYASVRGRIMALLFQEPLRFFDPLLSIEGHFREVLGRAASATKRREDRALMLQCLTRVNLPPEERVLALFPHELSGGMGQLISLALVLASGATIVLADEPTASLDTLTQALVMDLFKELNQREQKAILYSTHNISLLPGFADSILVLYAGSIVEQGPAAIVLDPAYPVKHPYTASLLAIAEAFSKPDITRYPSIPGEPYILGEPITGCVFRTRCQRYKNLPPKAQRACASSEPSLNRKGAEHKIKCLWV